MESLAPLRRRRAKYHVDLLTPAPWSPQKVQTDLDGAMNPDKQDSTRAPREGSSKVRLPPWPQARPYSSCKAAIGSIRAARRAGIQLEPSAMSAMVTGMAENTTGSFGLTPYI